LPLTGVSYKPRFTDTGRVVVPVFGNCVLPSSAAASADRTHFLDEQLRFRSPVDDRNAVTCDDGVERFLTGT
jgi:hypothetical protein